MQTLEFRPGRARIVFGLFGIGLALLIFIAIAAGSLMSGDTGRSYGGFALALAIIAFWVWGLLRVVRRMRDPKGQLLIDDEGVTDRTMPTPKISWASILMAQTIQTRTLGMPVMTLVRLDLTDEQERIQQLSSKQRSMIATNRSMGYGAFFVNLTSLPLRGEDFFRMMNERRALRALPALIDGVRTVPFDVAR